VSRKALFIDQNENFYGPKQNFVWRGINIQYQTPSKFGNTLRASSNTITELAIVLTLDVLVTKFADNKKQDACSIFA
jgi:hypothetical protein